MRSLKATCLAGLLVLAACQLQSPVPTETATPEPRAWRFEVDSATVQCQVVVSVGLAISHAQAVPGYLDCVTTPVLRDSDGVEWLCSVAAVEASGRCDGPRLRVVWDRPFVLEGPWHGAGKVLWTDPVELLGRVRAD